MKNILFIVGNIFFSLGVFLLGLTSILKQSLISILNYATQFSSESISFQIDFSFSIMISLFLIAFGLLQIGFSVFRKRKPSEKESL